MPVPPARLPAVLVGLTLTAALTGCAGTDSAASPSTASTSSAAAGAATASTAPTTASGQRIEVTVTGGQISGDTGRVPIPAGTQVTLAVTSDVADEVHVHGYDLTAGLAPGEPAELAFTATIPGVFEVELHDAGTVLLSLQVG